VPFPRVRLVKELLFKVHAVAREDGERVVSAKKLFRHLKQKELTMFRRNIKVYADILIPPADH